MVDAVTCLQCPYPDEVAQLAGRVLILERDHKDFKQDVLTRLESLSAQVGEAGAHSLAASRKLLEMVASTDADVKDTRREIIAAMARVEEQGAKRRRSRQT
jgi:hypothetical protein